MEVGGEKGMWGNRPSSTVLERVPPWGHRTEVEVERRIGTNTRTDFAKALCDGLSVVAAHAEI